MKLTGLAVAALSLLVVGTSPVGAQSDPLPNSGTYFITNNSNDEALQPNGTTIAQNVFTEECKKSGMQKWTIDRKIDIKTHKPTNRYTIKFAGENPNLNFQPHPISDHTAMVGDEKAVFVFEKTDNGIVVKAVSLNGDAMYSSPNPPMKTEVKFGPNDGSNKFRWTFTLAD